MKVTIDRDECSSCGTCWVICEEVFEEDDEGLSSIVEKYRVGGDPGKGEVPEDLRECVEEAADSCPMEGIHVE